jgi:hypothetical protein
MGELPRGSPSTGKGEHTMKLPLFQFLLPTHTNEGRSYEHARKAFKQEALKVAGGYTALAFVEGNWKGPDGRIYPEGMEPIQIGCTVDQCSKLAEAMFRLFPDQRAISIMAIGEIEIMERPEAAVAA